MTTKRSSPGTTACSLLLAFLGAIVAVYVINAVDAAIQTPRYGPLLTFVVFPLLGSIVAIPMCLIVTLLAWACVVLGRRWVHSSQVWADVVAVALTVVMCSALYLLVGLVLPTLREPLQLLAFFVALAVVLAFCVARGVGRQREATFAPPQPE